MRPAILGQIGHALTGPRASFTGRRRNRSFDRARPLWSRDSTIDINLPLWPAKLIVPVAFSVLVLQLWGYGRAVLPGLEVPVAVPLIQDAAEQAAAEAEHIQGRD